MSLIKLLAIDLGASSGRVMQGRFMTGTLPPPSEEFHRFKNEPVNLNDGLYWNLLHLFEKLSRNQEGFQKIRFRFVPSVLIHGE